MTTSVTTTGSVVKISLTTSKFWILAAQPRDGRELLHQRLMLKGKAG